MDWMDRQIGKGQSCPAGAQIQNPFEMRGKADTEPDSCELFCKCILHFNKHLGQPSRTAKIGGNGSMLSCSPLRPL